jgi:hypothetical protein
MTERKAFLLRLDKAVWAALDRLARTELRSVNAQIEFLLRDALPVAAPRRGNRGRGGRDVRRRLLMRRSRSAAATAACITGEF